jgi:hypothetical protein
MKHLIVEHADRGIVSIVVEGNTTYRHLLSNAGIQ